MQCHFRFALFPAGKCLQTGWKGEKRGMEPIPSPSAEAPRRRSWTWGALSVAAAAVASSLVACRSLGKDALEERLTALHKNQSAATHGLLRTTLQTAWDGENQEFELVYLHRPAQNPDPRRAPVVLVHGTPGTLFTWAPLLFPDGASPRLDDDRDVYAIEIIGHGIAPGDAAPYTFDRCSQFLVAALETLQLEPAHVIGNSYGGEFVWRAAVLAPERFASLVLMHPSGYERKDDQWLPEEEAMRDNPLAKIGWRLNSLKRVKKALDPHFAETPPDRAEEMFLVLENAHNWKAMVDLARDENGTWSHRLPEIQAPTLLLWGEREFAYPIEDFGQRFHADLPQSTLQEMPATGHYPQEEHPARLRELLIERFHSLESGF